MDTIRIERLNTNREFLSNDINRLLDKFDEFFFSKHLKVSLLCSEGKIANTLTEFLKETHEKVDLNIVNMSNPNENFVEDIKFSDAVIIYTTALKMAPKLMYDTLKSIERLGKNYYLILGGWNMIAKDKENVENKIKLVIKEYDFIDPLMILPVFKNDPVGLFMSFDEALDKILSHMIKNQDYYHKGQIETLMKMIEELSKKEFRLVKGEVQRDYTRLAEIQEYVQLKLQGYKVIFKNVNVDLHMMSDDINLDLNGMINVDLSKYFSDDDSQLTKVKLMKIENDLKNDIREKIDKFFEHFNKSDQKEILKIQMDVEKCISDMEHVVRELVLCKFVEQKSVEDLSKIISNDDNLQRITNLQEIELKRAIEKIIYKVSNEINNIKLDIDYLSMMNRIKKYATDGKSLIRRLLVSKSIEGDVENRKNDMSINERLSDGEAVTQVEGEKNDVLSQKEFISQIEDISVDRLYEMIESRMIELKDNLSVIISNELSRCEKSIKEKNQYYVQLYFEDIVRALETIQNDMKKKIKEF